MSFHKKLIFFYQQQKPFDILILEQVNKGLKFLDYKNSLFKVFDCYTKLFSQKNK